MGSACTRGTALMRYGRFKGAQRYSSINFRPFGKMKYAFASINAIRVPFPDRSHSIIATFRANAVRRHLFHNEVHGERVAVAAMRHLLAEK